MDDTLEIPRPRTANLHEEDDHSSGDEDGGLDWTKLPKFGASARPVIPKRGEKDFEPASGGGSGLQLHVLDRSRDAMFDALRASRAISSKTISYGIWYPSINRVHVTTARGIHFSTMGHSVSRVVKHENLDEWKEPSLKLPKRLELLPEEALYLIERGALFCYKSATGELPLADPSNYESRSPGAPMSVQQAFTELIGCEGITLERYQVYAYLKRLGFILIRAKPPTPEYPMAPLPILIPTTQPQTIIQRLTSFLSRLVSNITKVSQLLFRFDWWRHLPVRRQKTTQDIFKALRFIPCGHSLSLHHPAAKSTTPSKSFESSPYNVFFHVYKPSTPFRKTAPPAPDFHVVVVDARTTSVPTLQELSTLFSVLPDMPLPPPRKRGIAPPNKQPDKSQPAEVRLATPKTEPHGSSPTRTIIPSQSIQNRSSAVWMSLQRLVSFLPLPRIAPPPQRAKPAFTTPKPNPFLALKTGKKSIVIAAVDAGNISFFRFGQAVFEEWPMT